MGRVWSGRHGFAEARMSDWDETTKERVRELVTIETVGSFFDWEEMEPEYVKRLIEIREAIGMEPDATKKLKAILSRMPVDEEDE